MMMRALVLRRPAQLRAGGLRELLGRRDEALLRYRKAVRLLAGGTGRYGELARGRPRPGSNRTGG